MSQKKETGVLRRSVEAVVESAATRGVNVTADELFSSASFFSVAVLPA